MTTPLLPPTLVGREAQLDALQQRLEDVGSGRGGVLLLAGEAGVGKSRLLREALRVPEVAECVQMQVNCLEGDEAEPYSLARSLITASGRRAAELPVDPAPEAERQVRQVQQVLLPMLREARGQQPLLVAVEDVHWSDGPSLQVLLALSLLAEPHLFLLSYRPRPLTPALAAFLAEVQRLRLGNTVYLEPLSSAGTARMVRAMLGMQETLPPALLHEVMAATGGIPFLVEELLHTLVQQGDLKQQRSGWQFRRGSALTVPGALRHAIEGRLLRQSPEVIAVAEQAAVLGQVIDVPRLVRLTAYEETDLFAALRALLAAQILVQEGDTIAFRHALTREAIRTRLLRPERQALHRRVALMLEAEGDAASSTLAYHWSQAGDATRAARHAWHAAQQAGALHAHREAITHYELTLAAPAESRLAAEAAILSALGEHHQASGEQEEAIRRYQDAQAIYRSAGDEAAAAELDLRIGIAYGEQRLRRQALDHLQKAFTALPASHPQQWRAGLYLGLQQAASGDAGAAEETFMAAQEAARETTVARLRVVYELGGLRARHGDWQALEEAAQRVLQQVPEDSESDEGLALRHDAHAGLGTIAYYRGALQETLDQFGACLRIARQRALRGDELVARWNLATNALYHLGRWHEAREHLSRLQTSSGEGLGQEAIVFELWLNGQWEEAAERWLQSWPVMVETGDLELQMAFGRRIADLLLALGRPQQALELLQPLLARLQRFEARSFELQLIPRQAEALARIGSRQALQVCDEGLEMARALGGRPAEGLLLRAQALAQQQTEQWLDAFAGFEAATAILEALPMPYEVARTLREAGLARLARGRRGDRKRGAALLRRARQQFADLGATRDENATEAVLSAAGLAGERERGSGPLTVREQEVAELVAQGLSNAEIAERLFITEKTAAYHVGSILTKLDFTSRVQIAVYVTRRE